MTNVFFFPHFHLGFRVPWSLWGGGQDVFFRAPRPHLDKNKRSTDPTKNLPSPSSSATQGPQQTVLPKP